jgi:methylmalonyl-CoA mutase
MNEPIRFAEGFPTPSYEQWVAEVEKALKGAPFEKRMLTKTYEGVTLRPIYTRQDWPAAGDPSGFPGAMPFTRGSSAAGNRVGDWDIRQCYGHPDLNKANDIILNDLARGVSSLHLHFDRAARAGKDADGATELAGVDGLMVYSLDDLDRLLTGVQLDLAPVVLKAGAAFLPAAAMLMALWQRRRVKPEAALGSFGADPLGTLAATGALPAPVSETLAQMASLAKHTAATYPNVPAVEVNTTPYHNAGCTETQDLAVAMATAVRYLKAMLDAGMSVDDACGQILFTLSVPADQFLGIAKLRAARKMWARITEACGAGETARAMNLHAVTAMRMMSRSDPWVNILRSTVACFSAAVAGARSITVHPFTAAIGQANELSRRVARNTHVILAEESSLAKVIDPAGGSWYVETRTDEIAKIAWGEFQAMEKEGGIVAALESGALAGKISAVWEQRQKNIATRRDPLTGISEFPNILEAPLETEEADLAALRRVAGERLAAGRANAKAAPGAVMAALRAAGDGLVAKAIELAADGASLGSLAAPLAGSPAQVQPLPSHRLAEVFEALRDAADAYAKAHGRRPAIFLANLGTIAQHTARATFAKNFFETAGIEALTNAGFKDATACTDAFTASGAKVAIVCSADPIYEQMVPEVAPALKAAGCSFLFLAGNPGDKRESYSAAGVDDYIFMGSNVLEKTRATLARLGVIAQ